mmetsp:Transcript_6515/g.9817  ORF Transcript_6515/g.9817 Transcript_6515/m.9817 type:complete len:108 (-) Transcript_6515:260-583(-)|eukprot:CAMPEP_0171459780 /NCGR_PEP_ID=MMETSP0945-20130129/4918_1 /TAXON_ID=109269 /ORGANISM="Vaucheria litorea, Strain CCMP2940" /LENGTH=107 /DNA_ID=CAMNT_0011985849 /DNA_START=203 /DNA_END=526 /DNA_ORIENTATION=+
MSKGATSGASSQNVGNNPTPGGTRSAAAGRPAGAGVRKRRPVTKSNAAANGQEHGAVSQRETLRFYTDDAPGLKIGPTMVLVLSLLFIGFVVLLHIYGKMTGGSSTA